MEDQLIGKCYDVLDGKERRINILNHGYVSLVDCMPRLCPEGRTVEHAIVRAARTSYRGGLKSIKEDLGLLRYLIRNHHTSPLEFVRIVFKIKCPMFVARQIMRHRTTSINEVSARYTELPDEFYVPEAFRVQHIHNKQSSGEEFKDENLNSLYEKSCRESYDTYLKLLKSGVAREIARSVLPVGIYTEFYLTLDLNNLFKFLTLRTAEDCQYETRQVAQSMLDLTILVAPDAVQAWYDYTKVIKFNRRELSGEPLSKGEQNEFEKKKEDVSHLFDKPVVEC